ncbi:MAG: sigma-70 family RNA polymerase sigma factor [Puniceicoccales bacterium]|jgi:RNA polymerase sigma-70 factor (ECF subfamily)|nr:sigma-70 family RNA polymerase sigma factor [Puniceicoccales bacterium]
MTLNEENALERARIGDASAFSEIVTIYQDRIFAKVFSILRNRQDAEEITQDTFVRAQRGLPAFRGTASFTTWLYQIATNLARNRYWYWRRRRRDVSLSLDSPIGEDGDMTLVDVLPDEELTPVDLTINKEFVDRVAECMGQLKKAHREILVMRNVKSMAYEDIAEELGLSIGTVKSRIARAREALRSIMGEEFS